jgi:hypothetical protein
LFCPFILPCIFADIVRFREHHPEFHEHPPVCRISASIKRVLIIDVFDSANDTIVANVPRDSRQKSMVPKSIRGKTWLEVKSSQLGVFFLRMPRDACSQQQPFSLIPNGSSGNFHDRASDGFESLGTRLSKCDNIF